MQPGLHGIPDIARDPSRPLKVPACIAVHCRIAVLPFSFVVAAVRLVSLANAGTASRRRRACLGGVVAHPFQARRLPRMTPRTATTSAGRSCGHSSFPARRRLSNPKTERGRCAHPAPLPASGCASADRTLIRRGGAHALGVRSRRLGPVRAHAGQTGAVRSLPSRVTRTQSRFVSASWSLKPIFCFPSTWRTLADRPRRRSRRRASVTLEKLIMCQSQLRRSPSRSGLNPNVSTSRACSRPGTGSCVLVPRSRIAGPSLSAASDGYLSGRV